MIKNEAAAALGRLGRGKKKTLSAEEIARRTERIKAAGAKINKQRKLDKIIRELKQS